MSSLLKDIYSPEFYSGFATILNEVLPNFDKKSFQQQIFVSNWSDLTLKQRMKQTTQVLHHFMPKDFPKATLFIEKIINKILEKEFTNSRLEFLFFPDYIETYGLEHFDASVKWLEFVTQFITCEFAVRPFIIKYGEKMMTQMQTWSLHESHHVRRLASEGSRSRLPWGMALPEFKKNPTPVLPILENLKNDPSEYVRRSVANNLNDIAKDNPEIVISIAKKWKNHSKETDAIVKHACRTLLKQGHPEVLNHFGLEQNPDLKVKNFHVKKDSVRIGDYLEFGFTLWNDSNDFQLVRMEYAIYYLRKNGLHGKKVFKISERTLNPNEKLEVFRKQSFKIITTRKFYVGLQKISLIINGAEKDLLTFELIDN